MVENWKLTRRVWRLWALVTFGLAECTQASTAQIKAEVPLDLAVMIECANGPRGAGIIFKMQAQRLFVVTADHVVRKPNDRPIEEVKVYTHFEPGIARVGKVLRRDQGLDLAVIAVEGMAIDPGDLPFAVLGDVENFRKRTAQKGHTKAGVVGWYADEQWRFRLEPAVPMTEDTIYIHSPNFLNAGASGGPIFDEQQQLVGLFQGYVTETKNGRGRSISTVIAWLKKYFPVGLRPPPSVPAGWTNVFVDDLKTGTALNHALLVHGQYTSSSGGAFAPKIGKGLRVAGAHSLSAAWWDCALTPPFALALDFAVENLQTGEPVMWLRGPGYGLSRKSAIILTIIGGKTLVLRQADKDLAPGPLELPEVLDPTDWYHLEVEVDAERVRVSFQGKDIGAWAYSVEDMTGPLHSFVGLGAYHGAIGSKDAVVYRGFALRKPKKSGSSCMKVERLLFPLAKQSEAAPFGSPGAKVLFEDSFPGSKLSRKVTSSPSAVVETPQALSLQGINALPILWLDQPLQGDFQVDVEMSYPQIGDSVNFNLFLASGDHLSRDQGLPLVPGEGWALAFPDGEGNVTLRQFREAPVDFWAIAGSPLLAEIPFYAPVNGNHYDLRLRRRGNRLDVLSNRGHLFSVAFPADGSLPRSYYLGMGQIYGGSLVYKLRAVQITSR